MKVLLLYMPVFHRGYEEIVDEHLPEIGDIVILGQNIVDSIKSQLGECEEIRALAPATAARLLRYHIKNRRLFFGQKPVPPVRVVSSLEELWQHGLCRERQELELVVSNDSVTRRFVENYFPDLPAVYSNVFLRWNKENVFSQTDVVCDRVSKDLFDTEIMDMLLQEADKSSDWWRQVGAALVKHGYVHYTAYNFHLPTEHSPYFNGDPRDAIEAGKMSEYCSAIHAEQAIIGSAARAAFIPLEGASLYVTCFPCPACAKLIAQSGISSVYFLGGHASLDGVDIFKSANIEIVKVQL